jgi:hypothetical protein
MAAGANLRDESPDPISIFSCQGTTSAQPSGADVHVR